MQKRNRKLWITAVCLLAVFVLWTVAVRVVDVAAIGPRESRVGFATLNGYVHRLTGANMSLYTVTDWLGLVPIVVCIGFATLGLCQWIRRKSFFKVDKSILALGGFYIVVMAVYVLFEFAVINRRPVLIEGYLEASYPSSTTMLVLCVMPTAAMQLDLRVKDKALRRCMTVIIIAFITFMVVGRLLSGVHWMTDIIGGGLLSAGLVWGYRAAVSSLDRLSECH